MDPRTLEALHGSIRKWQRIQRGQQTNQGTSDCPLCQLFWINLCEGCPVREATGKTGCRGTPYYEYVAASGRDDYDDYEFRGEDMNYAARKEVAFLISLLPADERAKFEGEE